VAKTISVRSRQNKTSFWYLILYLCLVPLIPQQDKSAFISIVAAAPVPGGPAEAARLQTILNYYSDIPTAICRQLRLFAANNSYLLNALACFDDSQLQEVGIFQQKSGSTITNPYLIINSNYTNVIITETSPPAKLYLGVLGPSNIGTLSLTPGATLNQLIEGPGAVIDVLDASGISSPPTSPPTGCVVQQIFLYYEKSNPSYLNSVVYGSPVNSVYIEGKSFYGGVQENPNTSCAADVTNITVTDITNDAVYVSWTLPTKSSPPVPYLFVNVYYRLTNSLPWILATSNDGDFVGDTGFIFRYLQKFTSYDFNVCLTCLNGGIACVSISGQTVCCGVSSPP
jgi:hypothetical protein